MARRNDFFSGMGQFMDRMTQCVDRVNQCLDRIRDGVGRGWEVRETEDALLLCVDMPGLGIEDVKISVEHNTLIIKGECANEENVRRHIHMIDLQVNLYKIDQIKFEMKNGVLEVVMPKKE